MADEQDRKDDAEEAEDEESEERTEQASDEAASDEEEEDEQEEEEEEPPPPAKKAEKRAAAEKSEPKRRRAEPARPVLPPEKQIAAPGRQTLIMLGVMAGATLLMWGSARFACNAHPAQTRKPREVSTAELSRDPKGAALELQQRWNSYDFKGALELAKGPIAEELTKAKGECDKDPSGCESKQKALADQALATAALLSRGPGNAKVRVTSRGGAGGNQTVVYTLEQEGSQWKVSGRGTEDPTPPPAPTPAPAGAPSGAMRPAPTRTPATVTELSERGEMGDEERRRLAEEGERHRLFGPYLSERQWGTVREDYSADGNAWDYFPHEHARSRAYRWGEDGLAGISDTAQRLCLAIALWNGKDSILKERLFGLTNGQGNHGEDVKELYYYLDATPTHSYLKYLYKYPQRAYPYEELVSTRRGAHEPELELEDTGVFDEARYFDVFVEWAKADADDLVLRVTVENRGPEPATIHVLPQIWFRNVWSWGYPTIQKPCLFREQQDIVVEHEVLGRFRFTSAERDAQLLFTENDTNEARLWGRKTVHCWKDAFHERVVGGRLDVTSALEHGTKACFWLVREIPAGGSVALSFRLRPDSAGTPLPSDEVLERRRAEADAFYAELGKNVADPEKRRVLRQALAGLIWSKQTYRYDVRGWLSGDPLQPSPPEERRLGRNNDWEHLHNREVISMPDKWEYPWYAAWDLAFHTLPFGLVDLEFAKGQLVMLTREWYMHPNGQLPAYEWALGDVNPPVHAWAAWKLYKLEERQKGKGDRAFLERVFHKLLLNFTWWVNRKDAAGRNIFQGGFLGLDNIGVFDRSSPLPTGGYLDQSDGTAWVAAYALQLMRIALELSYENPTYQDIASKFFEHFLHIAEAMTRLGGKSHGLWDEEDGFYYDSLHLPNGRVIPIKVRSMVGLLPLFAVEVLEPEELERAPEFKERLEWFLDHRQDLAALVSRWNEPGRGQKRLLSLLRGSRMKRLFKRMLDENEFLSPYGVRGLSRHHAEQPYRFSLGRTELEVRYEPGESESRLFGGNSNWRGPIWFPVNFLLIDAMREYHRYYGDDFRIECPTRSGRFVSIAEAADEIAARLIRIFLPGSDGVRPFFSHRPELARDPHFKDYLLFHEYFHGDTARGVGAMHQTGWTALVANLITGIGADGR